MFEYVREELPETFDDMYIRNDNVHDHRTGQDDLYLISQKWPYVIKELLYRKTLQNR